MTELERKEPELKGSVVVVVVVVVGKSQSPDSKCIVDTAWYRLTFVIFATSFHCPVRGSNSRISSELEPPKYTLSNCFIQTNNLSK